MLLTSHTLDHPMLPDILGDFSLDFLRLSVLESLEDRETRFFRSSVMGAGWRISSSVEFLLILHRF